jgi:hypothetical protein
MGVEYLFVGPELYKLARGLKDLAKNHDQLVEKGTLNTTIDKLIKGADGFFKNYDATVDQKIFELLTELYLKETKEGRATTEYASINIPAVIKLIY